MRVAGALIIAAMLLPAIPVKAETVDLSTIKCKDFLDSGKDNISYIVMWLDGYYKEKDDPAVIDFDKFTKEAERLGKYCGANPDIGLITASDKVLVKKED